MLQTYENTTNTIRHFLDVDGKPHQADLEETISYLDRNSKPGSIDGLDIIVETDDESASLYIGYAVFGTAEDEPGWAIKKRVVVDSVERWKWASGGFVLQNRWDQRASLEY